MADVKKLSLILMLIIGLLFPFYSIFSDENISDIEVIDNELIFNDYDKQLANKSTLKIYEKTTLSNRFRTAFPVGENFIITSGLRNPNGKFFIEYEGKEIAAIYQTTDSTGRMSLFRIPNVNFLIPNISLETVGSNREVHVHYFSRDDSTAVNNAHGKFQKVINSEMYGPDSYLHNLDDFLDRESIGAPIFNNCGEIIGMNIRKDNSFTSVPTKFIALGHEAILKFINEQGIKFSQSNEKCFSEIEKRELVNQERANKEEEAKIAEEEKREANAAREEAEKKQAEAEKERIQKENTNKNLVYAVIISAVFFIVLVFFLLRNISKRRKELNIVKDTMAAQELLKSEKGPDFVLRGPEMTIKIPGDKLGTEQGVILGRNTSEADVILDRSEISRSHLRLFIKDGIIYADDLGSANGTILNGARLSSGRPMAIHNGDEITLAGIIFSVQGL